MSEIFIFLVLHFNPVVSGKSMSYSSTAAVLRNALKSAFFYGRALSGKEKKSEISEVGYCGIALIKELVEPGLVDKIPRLYASCPRDEPCSCPQLL